MHKYHLNKLLFFIFSCYNFTFNAQSKVKDENIANIEVKYLYSYVSDTLNSNNRNEELMILLLNSKTSIYASEKYIQAKNIIKNKLSNVGSSPVEINGNEIPKYKIKYSVYANDGKSYITSLIGRDNFTFEGTQIQWNTNYTENKIILNYKCYKATTKFNNRIYTAWYTKGIPFSEGPYRFKGLPGLILNVSDNNGYDSFTAIGIEKKSDPIIQLSKGIEVTREQYLKKREEFKNNPFPQDKRLSQERRNQMIEMSKKSNNSLER